MDRRRRTIRFLRKALATVCSVTLVLQSSVALAADVTTYSYDQARTGAYNIGRLTTVANTAATVEKDYDVQGNVIRQGWTVDSTAYEHSYTYAPHGELLRRSFSDGELLPSATETYQYDEFGNLKSIPGLVTNITRTATFEPLVTTYANGVTETRSYDPNRQWLLSITSSNSGGTIFTESYTRNNRGLITTVASNRANGNWSYGYDTAYRLISATNLDSSSYTQTFQYDAADNMTYNSQVGSYTYPSPVAARPHAVTQAGSLTYAYDANGNLTSGGGRTITYDGQERPTVVTALGQTTSFVYGPEGKRLKKTSAGDTTLYLGADEEITPSGDRIKHPYSDVRKVGATINWMQRDHLSSVRLMTDATGTVISENHFRPYGERTDVQVSLTVPRESKGWIGERDDPETGLTYLNARYYDPVLARFVSPDWFDPSMLGVGTNRYAYALNNPIAHKDPSGNCGFGDCVALAYAAYRIGRIGWSLISLAITLEARKPSLKPRNRRSRTTSAPPARGSVMGDNNPPPGPSAPGIGLGVGSIASLKGSGWQVHHVVPRSTPHASFLEEIGFDIEADYNKQPLPSRSDLHSTAAVHRGKQNAAYDALVNEPIANIERAYRAGQINAQQARDLVNEVLGQTRSGLYNGTIELNNAEKNDKSRGIDRPGRETDKDNGDGSSGDGSTSREPDHN